MQQQPGVAPHGLTRRDRQTEALAALEGIVAALSNLAVRSPDERAKILAGTAAALDLITLVALGGAQEPLRLGRAA